MYVAGCSLRVSTHIKSLGVVIDDHLPFDRHVSAVASACMYHARALRHVRGVLSTETAKTIACSIAALRLDYCNSLLSSAPASTVDKLQRAQNVLARVVLQAKHRASAKPLLRQLHWLPVRERISYKVALLTYKAHIMSSPDYLTRLLHRHVPTRSQRSSVAPLLLVLRTQTNIGKRAFSVTAPSTWNALPNDVRQSDSLAIFKSRLKTALFTTAFDS